MGRTVNPEAAQTSDHIQAHAEPTDAVSRLTTEAHESYNTVKFEPASANPNPGNNVEVAAMLAGFSLNGELAQPYQIEGPPPINLPGEYSQTPNSGQEAYLQNPGLQTPELPGQFPGQFPGQPESPFQLPGQNPDAPFGMPGQPLDAQSQTPGAVNPMDQALFGMLAQNGDATQQAVLGIDQSIASGLLGMMTGAGGGYSDGDSSDGSDDSGNSDGSSDGGSDNGSNDGSYNSADNSQQDDSASFSTPAWMQQYALANF
jgi:hypothetical protein